MAQKLDLGHSHSCKSQPLILYPRSPSTSCGTSVPSYPGLESGKGDLAPFESGPHSLEDCPDGGLQAWLVVLGASCASFATSGFSVSWGVFQNYYETVLPKGTSPSTIAWIGSIQYFLFFFPALISGRLFDLGYLRSTLLIASINLIGFGVGISCGFVYGPVISVLAHWFKKRRSTALGIVTFSSSIGGMVIPVLFRNLLSTIGFKWTMRIIALILTLAIGIANLTIRRRFPPTTISGGLFNPKQFRSLAYTVYTASGLIICLGVFAVLTFIDASSHSQGVPESFSSYLVSIANAGNAVGRLSSGILADKFGPINVMIPSSFFTGVLTLIWPHARGTAALVTVAMIYGASSGALEAVQSAPMMALGGSADVGRRTGMYFTIVSLGSLTGPPISGAINHSTGGYVDVGIFAGGSLIVAVLLLALSRYFVLGGWRGKA